MTSTSSNQNLNDSNVDTWELISVERRRLADELEGLTPEQWATQSQCEHWTVSEVASHLVTPFETSTAKFGWTMLRSRFDFDTAIRKLADGVNSANTTGQLVAKLRANSENDWTPPGAGKEAPMAEIVVHGQDIRRALGLDHNIPAATIRHALNGIEDLDIRSDYARRVGVALSGE